MSTLAGVSGSWQPWPERLFGKSPLSPLWGGVGISLLTLAVLGAVTGLGGEMADFRESGSALLGDRDARLAVLICVLVGFLPASQQYMLRFTQANVLALEPLLGRAAEPLTLPRPSFWACILPGLLAIPAIGYAIDRDLSFYLQPAYFSRLIHVFQWAVGFFVTVNVALCIHLTLACAGALARRADVIPRIDLLVLAALAPFARQSLQTLLVWLLAL